MLFEKEQLELLLGVFNYILHWMQMRNLTETEKYRKETQVAKPTCLM